MRILSRPSTANCNIEMYVRYLLSEPQLTTCTGLSDVLPDVSHDSVNRFLLRENYSPSDLKKDIENKIEFLGGVMSVDDMVIDKPYSDSKKSDLIGYFYSGKHHRPVKGINLVTLYYTDPHDVCVPINFRIVDPTEKKTKNEYFREMLKEALAWGFKPICVTGDSWYSSIENLKFIRKYGLGMLFGIDSNRVVSVIKGSYCQVQAIQEWDDSGKIVYLKGFGMVRIFKQKCKDSFRYYVVAMQEINMLDDFTDGDFKRIHSAHWNIERFHRAAKQLCSIEKFQVRNINSVRNHIFCSIIGFIKLEIARTSAVITNWYELKKELYVDIVRDFIGKGIKSMEESNLMHAVNA